VSLVQRGQHFSLNNIEVEQEKKRFSSCMVAEAVVLTNLITVARFEALTRSSE
jgi:hypothetical protein